MHPVPGHLADPELGDGSFTHHATGRPEPALFRRGMRLAVGGADPGAGAATDTGSLIVHHHDLLLDLVLVVVEVDELALVGETLERHHVAAANLEAAAAPDAFLLIDGQEISRLPAAPIPRDVAHDLCLWVRRIRGSSMPRVSVPTRRK